MSDYIQEAVKLVTDATRTKTDIANTYDRQNKDFDAKERSIRGTDYTADEKETYRLSLTSLENIYSEWDSIQRRTKGLTFHICDYMRSCHPRPVPAGGVAKYFENLVAEGRDAIVAVSRSQSVEDDIAPQKRFCQCLADLRYVVQNAARLLKDSGKQEHEVVEHLRQLDGERHVAAQKHKEQEDENQKKIQNAAEDLRRRIREEHTAIEAMRIGAPIEDRMPDYRFLVGFEKADEQKLPPPSMRAQIDRLLDLPELWESTSPVYFDPRNKNGVLIIRAPGNFFDPDDGSKQAVHLIRNLYFTFSAALPPKSLLFVGVESTIEALLQPIALSLSRALGEGALFGKGVYRTGQIGDLLSRLRETVTERSSAYGNRDDVSSFFEYNEKTPDDTEPLIFTVFNNLPDCLGDNPKSTIRNFTEILNRAPQKGVIPIVCVNADAEETFLPGGGGSDQPNGASSLKADVMEIGPEGEIRYNGVPLVLNKTVMNFQVDAYLSLLKKREADASVLTLDKILTIRDAALQKSPAPHFYEKICVPIGMQDGKYFSFDFSVCNKQSFGLITGSNGSGKSSFLHTLILSMGYCYAPDELSLYLADFKSDSNSPEFSKYAQKEKDNLYIPHVKYLSLRNRRESALDLFAKIANLADERSRIFQKYGVGEMKAYNALPAVRQGEAPKMPFALFIIDEYLSMFDDSSYEFALELSGKVQSVVNKVRAFGIGVFMSGQYVSPSLNRTTTQQMGSRISFNLGSDQALATMFDLDYDKRDKYAEALLRRGAALFSSEDGKNPHLVQVAYAGGTGSPQQLLLARRIREKYHGQPGTDFVQTEAGGEGLYPAVKGLTLPDAIQPAGVAIEDSTTSTDSQKLFLPIGVSSTSSLRISLRFSTGKNTSGYAALASREKLFLLERTAIFSFLHEYSGKIYYLANRADSTKFFSGFGMEEETVRKAVISCQSTEEIARTVELLMAEYVRREKESRDSEMVFSPCFVVMHDIEWLFETGIIGTRPSAPVAEARNTDKDKAEALRAETSRLGLSKDSKALKYMGLVANSICKSADVPAEETKIYNIADVKKNVFRLHATGNRYGIFVLLASETYDPFKAVIAGTGVGEGTIFSAYTVYGSYDDMSNRNTPEESNNGCLYIKPDGAKTRVLDICPENCPELWEDIKRKIEGAK